jgi:hypothetical protein
MNNQPINLKLISYQAPHSLDHVLINYRRDRRQRLLQAMTTVAGSGCSVTAELCELMENNLGLMPGNHSIRNAFTKDLLETGLAITETYRFIGPSKLSLTRLTDIGHKVCAEMGLKTVESEWDQMIRGHNGLQFPRHTLGVLAFAYQARRRGWKVVLLPYTGTPVEPDLLVSRKDDEPIYVEFETKARARGEKWYKNRLWNTYVAVATFTASIRRALVQECKEVPVRGLATDLQTLVQQDKLGVPGSLWQEKWGRW